MHIPWLRKISKAQRLRQTDGKRPLRIAIDVRQAPGSAPTSAAAAVVDSLLDGIAELDGPWQFLLVTSDQNQGSFDGYMDRVLRCCLPFAGSRGWRKNGNGPAYGENLHRQPSRCTGMHIGGWVSRWLPKERWFGGCIVSETPEAALAERVSNASDLFLRPDLVFLPFARPLDWPTTIPRVMLAAEVDSLVAPYVLPLSERDAKARRLAQALAFVDAVVCLSERSRNAVAPWCPQSSDHVVHVELAPRSLLHVPSDSAGSAAGRSSNDAPLASDLGMDHAGYLACIADFEQVHNHQLVITAFGQFLAANPHSELQLLCAGATGVSLPELAEAVSRMGLADRVRFVKVRCNRDVETILRQCRGLVAASLYDENPIPVHWAVELGKPVLLSSAAGFGQCGGTGVYRCDPRLPRELAQGFAWVERQTRHRLRPPLTACPTTAMARCLLDLFTQVIAQRRKPMTGVFGLHADGWTSGRLAVTFPAGRSKRRLVWELSAPDFAPTDHVVADFENGTGRRRRFALARGERRTISLSLPASAGSVVGRVYPTFRPADHAIGEDPRALGLFSHGWKLVDEL